MNSHLDHDRVDGLILTEELSRKAQQKSKDELAKARRRVQSKMTERDRLVARILQFKLRLADYLGKEGFDADMKFGSCLARYVHILEIKRRTFANEIGIDEVKLSQVINDHRKAPEYLFIRLEIHSNNNIPARWWYRLVQKENEHLIATNTILRKQERKHIRKKLGIKV